MSKKRGTMGTGPVVCPTVKRAMSVANSETGEEEITPPGKRVGKSGNPATESTLAQECPE